jgi:hypothetical protein
MQLASQTNGLEDSKDLLALFVGGRNLRLRSMTRVTKGLRNKGLQMCSGHGVNAALLECLTPQCRHGESIKYIPHLIYTD